MAGYCPDVRLKEAQLRWWELESKKEGESLNWGKTSSWAWLLSSRNCCLGAIFSVVEMISGPVAKQSKQKNHFKFSGGKRPSF